MPLEFARHPVVQEREFVRVDDVAEMVEVLPEVVNRLFDEAVPISRIGPIGRGMPCSDILPEFLHVADGQASFLELPVQTQVLVETTHLHGVVQHFAITAKDRAFRRTGDCNDADIDVRGPGAVEAYFFFAEMPALFERAEVQEIELYRFLDLVRIVTRENDPRDVRLDEFNRIGRMVEGRGS